ncbi:CXADR-like membrane protein [Ctenopharyngodon idella]|uniref:CXADR-like membrane protein n=1 Tax=Ctenopharyngodon idella TaxID=7959 RepID=UPI002232003E|nr:CXADR-like membrane protein [Ctenopharyngodon idella]
MRFIILIWTFLFIFHLTTENISVTVSAPEKHSLVLMCDKASDIDWSHGLRRVIASKHGQQVSYLDQRKHQLLSDGTLHIRDLQPSDAGQYYCNDQLIANIAVLKGQNFTILAGTTVYLPCKTSDKFKQRWAFKRTAQSRKEFISTLYKNSTVKKERDDPTSRFTHTINHLIISNLQLQDSGLYLCNNREMAFLTVTTDVNNNSPEMNNNLSILLALCLLAIICVCVLSVILSCRRTRTNTRKESGPTDHTSGLPLHSMTDEGRWMPDAHEDTGEMQYESLDVQQQNVIYSTLLIRPKSS